jgi:hypothetical protein
VKAEKEEKRPEETEQREIKRPRDQRRTSGNR